MGRQDGINKCSVEYSGRCRTVCAGPYPPMPDTFPSGIAPSGCRHGRVLSDRNDLAHLDADRGRAHGATRLAKAETATGSRPQKRGQPLPGGRFFSTQLATFTSTAVPSDSRRPRYRALTRRPITLPCYAPLIILKSRARVISRRSRGQPCQPFFFYSSRTVKRNVLFRARHHKTSPAWSSDCGLCWLCLGCSNICLAEITQRAGAIVERDSGLSVRKKGLRLSSPDIFDVARVLITHVDARCGPREALPG